MKRLALALLFAMPLFAVAQTAAPSKETDEQRFVRLTREMEQRPLQRGSNPDATWLVTWAIDTPDYEALACKMAGPEWDLKDSLAGPLMVTSMLGNIAWQIEHGKDSDELSKQVAATETALRIYTATVASDPSKQSAFFDALIAKRDAGTLRAYMAPIVAKACVADAKAAGGA